jgi:hypothetical protein
VDESTWQGALFTRQFVLIFLAVFVVWGVLEMIGGLLLLKGKKLEERIFGRLFLRGMATFFFSLLSLGILLTGGEVDPEALLFITIGMYVVAEYAIWRALKR